MAIATFAWNVVQDAIHRKVFYVLLALAVLMIFLVPLLPSAQLGIQVDLFREAALGLITIVAFLIAVIMAATTVNRDTEQKLIYNLISKPVERWQYYLGKFLGIMLVLALALAMIFIVLITYVFAKFNVFNPALAKSLFTIFLEASILASFAMLASVYLSPLVCVLAAILFYVLGHVKGDYLYSAMHGGNPIARFASGSLYYLLPNLERFNINEAIAHGETVFKVGLLDLFLLFLVAAAFSAIFLAIGIFLFSRRDL
jgi:ABC-type transport system involved in multi-copper enzyme maturation permease subunit